MMLTSPSLAIPLRWRHNDHAGVSNHQPHGCLLNRLFRRKSKKTSKLRVTGLCAGIHRWISRTNGQLRGKCFHLMTSSCRRLSSLPLGLSTVPKNGEFPAQMASYAENVSIWWRHHAAGCRHCHLGCLQYLKSWHCDLNYAIDFGYKKVSYNTIFHITQCKVSIGWIRKT